MRAGLLTPGQVRCAYEKSGRADCLVGVLMVRELSGSVRFQRVSREIQNVRGLLNFLR